MALSLDSPRKETGLSISIDKESSFFSGLRKLVSQIWLKPLRNRSNEISIQIANVPPNASLGSPGEDLARLRAQFGNRFRDPSEKLVDIGPDISGLVGSLQLKVIPYLRWQKQLLL